MYRKAVQKENTILYICASMGPLGLENHVATSQDY